MRKVFKRFLRWVMEDNSQTSPEPSREMGMGAKVISTGINDRNNGMNFTVFSATGGKVIQFATYDPTRDRHQSNLYVVTDKEDLGEEIAQIITRESLTR